MAETETRRRMILISDANWEDFLDRIKRSQKAGLMDPKLTPAEVAGVIVEQFLAEGNLLEDEDD